MLVAAKSRIASAKNRSSENCASWASLRKSPVGVFRALVEIHKKENLSFRNVVVFSLDEFFPISPKEQQSRNWLIHESLLDHVDILPENIHIPDSTLPLDKVAAFCRDYEAKIEEYGGLDLLFLGTGVQGQLGFNEPGSYTNTRTRLVALGNESRQAVSSIFYGIDNVPRKAITMGLGTILKAKRIILMAWGEEKCHRNQGYRRRRGKFGYAGDLLAKAPQYRSSRRRRRLAGTDPR